MRFAAFAPLCLASVTWGTTPDAWIPARWQGGPLELVRRVRSKTAPAGAPEREALENWYDPATLDLLEDSPINCLLVTWSSGANADLERRQQQLVKSYAAEAHRRGLAVVGLIHPGALAAATAKAAADAALDGLTMDGDFPAGFAEEVTNALAAAGSSAMVIPILREAPAVRAANGRILAVQGVSPTARRLTEMGIRAGPSGEPWIEFNIWSVRSLRFGAAGRPVWLDYQLESGSATDYLRAVADASVAGGHWVIALDDNLRVGLWRRHAAVLDTWARIGSILRFAREHADWRTFSPYGNLAIVVDTVTADSQGNDYLKLAMRRQVPYRLIARPELGAPTLRERRAVLVAHLETLADGERETLRDFAEKGGVVIAGPFWGDPPRDQPYAEKPFGKGRLVVYKDPDPESVARDLRDLLSQEEMGITAFNVPSVIMCGSTADSGRRVLVQLLNYSSSPAVAITIRVQGTFNSARWYIPDAAPSNLAVQRQEGHTDVSISKLALWGGILLER